MGGRHGGFDVPAEGVGPALRDARLHEIERPDDPGQEIVEIVGDAAGQLSDGLHLLGLSELLLQVLALRDVAADAVQHVSASRDRPVDPAISPVLCSDPYVEVASWLLGSQDLDLVTEQGEVLRVNESLALRSDEVIIRVVAEKVGPGRIDGADLTVRAEDAEQVTGQAPDAVAL